MPRMTWVAPRSTASSAWPSAQRRSSAVVPGRDLGADVERRRIAADRREGGQERVTLLAVVAQVRWRAEGDDRGERPAIADRGGQRDPAPFLPAEPQRRTAGCQRRRLVGRFGERVEGVGPGHAGRRGRRLGPERLEDVDRRLEPVEPLRHRRHRDAERGVLALVPAGAQADDEPAARGVIQDRGGLRQDARVAERVGQHGMPDPLARHAVDEGGHRGQRLETGSVALAGDVDEVVVHPDRLEYLVLADARPGAIERRPVDGLGRGLDPDRDVAGRQPTVNGRRPVTDRLAASARRW